MLCSSTSPRDSSDRGVDNAGPRRTPSTPSWCTAFLLEAPALPRGSPVASSPRRRAARSDALLLAGRTGGAAAAVACMTWPRSGRPVQRAPRDHNDWRQSSKAIVDCFSSLLNAGVCTHVRGGRRISASASVRTHRHSLTRGGKKCLYLLEFVCRCLERDAAGPLAVGR